MTLKCQTTEQVLHTTIFRDCVTSYQYTFDHFYTLLKTVFVFAWLTHCV